VDLKALHQYPCWIEGREREVGGMGMEEKVEERRKIAKFSLG